MIGGVRFYGVDAGAAQELYGRLQATIVDTTAGSEDAFLSLSADLAGTLTNYMHWGANAAGTATPNAVGLPLGQLSFPATQNASADANTLDDYEEGTFTPAMTFGGSATGVTFTTQSGRYTKIGREVFFDIFINLSNNGSGTGSAAITGLPFTSVAGVGSVAAVSNWANFSGVVGNPVGLVRVSDTTISLNMSGAAASVAMTDTNITNTASFTISGRYAST